MVALASPGRAAKLLAKPLKVREHRRQHQHPALSGAQTLRKRERTLVETALLKLSVAVTLVNRYWRRAARLWLGFPANQAAEKSQRLKNYLKLAAAKGRLIP